ncbi:MAG: hypothetical protein U0075_13550 [Thermomicrobiales bacterium]
MTPPAGDASHSPSSSLPLRVVDLTFREQEVLELLVWRLTNVEIGARLYIQSQDRRAPSAPSSTKLGAANRRDAAAIALRHNLI